MRVKKKTAGNFLTTSAKELGWVEKKMVDVSFFMFFFPPCILFSAPCTLEKLVAKKKKKKEKTSKNRLGIGALVKITAIYRLIYRRHNHENLRFLIWYPTF